MRRLSSKKKAPPKEQAESENSTPSPKDKKTPPKKRARSGGRKDSSDEDTSNTFEVDSVVGARIIHGQQQYKIHWKGYPSSKDTWELETNLNCPDLVKKYLKEVEEEEEERAKPDETANNGQAGSKRKISKKGGGPSKKSKDYDNGQAESDDDEQASSSNAKPKNKGNSKKKAKSASEGAGDSRPSDAGEINPSDEEEYEVQQILDVLLDKGKRYFLVRWKGYGSNDDTWEPESNLESSQQLIEEYLTSHPILDEEDSGKRTRESPRKTTGFPVSPTGKRHSRRSHNRNRATYFDQE